MDAHSTLIAKPAPTTPLTTLLFGELCAAILLAGVVNILADENELGPLLSGHKDIAKVAFTGSTATGAKVIQAAAGTIKRVTLELGGNDAALVLDDVVDDGMAQGAQMGPVQNRMQFDKLAALLDEVRGEGTVLAGGAPLDRPGFFIPPTILCDLPDSSRLVQEEQFGPVLPVLRYTDIEDVIARINASPYGLGGSVRGADVARATQVAMRIDSGTVWVNQHLAVDNSVPFRGAKQSGLGGELGQEGLHEYSQPVIINAVNLPS